ncbi:MAG TPA: sensor histidine kinase [Pseudomonas sp.]|uniref:sensor histidine kinase n=1 Tax=Pseudomonas sp. TaxID=306 RepID=UPI002C2CFC26|nr:sensor histidine kinase [Pseudomonas sp.]HWH85192.1 sensor histidine kinase [Pseudomonas sp.]
MRLADFILHNIEPILQHWEDFAKTLTPASTTMDSAGLRDHAEQMLRTIAADLQTSQSSEESTRKSHGAAPSVDYVTSAETHAETRHLSGFTIGQMIAEYRALRTSVLALWMPPDHVSKEHEVRDIIRFNEAVDQALAESVVTYTEAVNGARNVFLGILGHDLRSPLGAILLSADVLLREPELAPKVTKNASRIYTSVKRSIKIVGDLLDFTRTQLGSGIPVRVAEDDLAMACLGMVEEARAYHPDRQIKFQTQPLPLCKFDKSRIEQVIANLIGNAIQHGDAHSPVKVILAKGDGDVLVQVHNLGEPITEAAKRSIFNPMARHLENGKPEYGASAGLGLGLHIASAIVSAHGGTIDVDSHIDRGTTFTVRLPLQVD